MIFIGNQSLTASLNLIVKILKETVIIGFLDAVLCTIYLCLSYYSLNFCLMIFFVN
jgi:hypothetical protein